MEKLISEFSIGLFFWQTVIFVILIFLLKKYAWKPILDAVNDREEGIKNALLSAEKAKEEMVSLQSDNEATLKKARAERDLLLKEAREMKQQLIEAAKDEAKESYIIFLLSSILNSLDTPYAYLVFIISLP